MNHEKSYLNEKSAYKQLDLNKTTAISIATCKWRLNIILSQKENPFLLNDYFLFIKDLIKANSFNILLVAHFSYIYIFLHYFRWKLTYLNMEVLKFFDICRFRYSGQNILSQFKTFHVYQYYLETRFHIIKMMAYWYFLHVFVVKLLTTLKSGDMWNIPEWKM